jgi:hypothetical protein
MNQFHVGQKVVCIDEFGSSRFPMEFPVINFVYQIRGIHSDETGSYLWLAEIVNPSFEFSDGTMEPAFDAEGFRPLVERKTNISVFKAMLTPQKQRVSA